MKREWSLEEIKKIAQGGGGGAVDSVNGKTGTVVLTPSDLGLGNVDNTHDNVKNVATAQIAGKLSTPRTIGLSGDITGAAQFDGSSNITIDTVIQAPFVQTVNGNSGDITVVEPKTVTLTGDATGSATFDSNGNITIATTVSGGGSGGPAVTYVAAQSDMTDKTKIYSINGQENELYHTDGTTVFKIYPVAATPLYKHFFTIKRAGKEIALILVDQDSTPIQDNRFVQRVKKAVSIRMVAGSWMFTLADGSDKELGVITFMINETGQLELEGSNSPTIAGEAVINRRLQYTKSTYSMMNDDTVTAL